jgi:hypothetical protein
LSSRSSGSARSPNPPSAHRDQAGAERRLVELMWEGEWVEVPAAYDSAGQPLDGGWRRAGGGWVRED